MTGADPQYRATRTLTQTARCSGGIRYARNAALHGEEVAATTYTNPASLLGVASLRWCSALAHPAGRGL